MRRIAKTGLFLLFGASAMMSPGCGPGARNSPEDGAAAFQQNSLSEVSEIIGVYMSDARKAPSGPKDFVKYRAGWPGGSNAVKDGVVVVEWGASIRPGASDSILAYNKEVPNAGGLVLMQDGTTIKKMTADEFKAAKKAAKD